MENSIEVSKKKKQARIELPHDPATSFLGVYTKELK